ncbi:MAG: ImmA/IrrE family metallo-endopeptidase [Clostridiales bacterium]|nr:ImmA/IrrE family metallo-endopeptidase [Clostridiales bacterium]
MKMNISISKVVLDWVIRTAELNEVANNKIELLRAWRSGSKTPTFNQVESMSKTLNIPLGYFFLEQPPIEDCFIVKYRTVENMYLPEPSRNLIDTLDTMVDIQTWMADYLVDNGQEALQFVGIASDNNSIIEIADMIREAARLPADWSKDFHSSREAFNHLRNCLSDLGILIMLNGIVGSNTRRKLNVEEFRAFTLVNKYVPLIFINSCDTDNGKIFSLLHETAHIWIGKDSFYNSDDDSIGGQGIEVICNAVAAEILVPRNLFITLWKQFDGDNLERIDKIAKRFNCSQFVVVRRALDTNNISKREYLTLTEIIRQQYDKWKKDQKTKNTSGGNYYDNLSRRLDHHLLQALAYSAKEGRTQYSEVYRLTNTNRATFDKLLAKIGGVG